MEVDEDERFVVSTAALAWGEAEAAQDVVGSSARGKADKGKMGTDQTRFLVPVVDPY